MRNPAFFIPVYLSTLGFLLSVLGLIFRDSTTAHDASIALISGSFGMLTPLVTGKLHER